MQSTNVLQDMLYIKEYVNGKPVFGIRGNMSVSQELNVQESIKLPPSAEMNISKLTIPNVPSINNGFLKTDETGNISWQTIEAQAGDGVVENGSKGRLAIYKTDGMAVADNVSINSKTVSITIDEPSTTGRIYSIPDATGDADFIMSESDQTLNGIKTFSSAILSSIVPTIDDHVTNKKYVDTSIANIDIPLNGIQSFEFTNENSLYPEAGTYIGTTRNVTDQTTLIQAISESSTGDIVMLTSDITLTATLTINKSIKLDGNIARIIQSTADASEPVNLINVTANNVYITSNVTIKHRKTTNTSIESCITSNTTGFVSMANIEFMEAGYILRGSFNISGKSTYTGSLANNHRHMIVYSLSSPSIIQNVIYDFPQEATVRDSFIYMSVAGADYFESTLKVTNCIQLDKTKTMRQFYLIDTLQKTVNGHPKLIFENCQFNDVNGGIGLIAPINTTPLDFFSGISIISCIQGDAGIASYKGLIYLDGSGTSNLNTCPIYYANNKHPFQVRVDYTSIQDNGGICFKNTVFTDNTPLRIIENFQKDNCIYNFIQNQATKTDIRFVDATSSIQTQLNTKEGTITAGTTSQYLRGDKTFQDIMTTNLSNWESTDTPTNGYVPVWNGSKWISSSVGSASVTFNLGLIVKDGNGVNLISAGQIPKYLTIGTDYQDYVDWKGSLHMGVNSVATMRTLELRHINSTTPGRLTFLGNTESDSKFIMLQAGTDIIASYSLTLPNSLEDGYLKNIGGQLSWGTPDGGTPVVTYATSTSDGILSAFDWNEFYAKAQLPTDAEGFLKNDGLGTYTWSTPTATPPTDYTSTVDNTIVGNGAGNIANLTGINNVSFGANTITQITSGAYNTVIGFDSCKLLTTGNCNISVGTLALKRILTGSTNVCIGYGAGYDYTSNETNNIVIGNQPGATGEANTIRIGSNQSSCYIKGIYGQGSSGSSVFINSDGQLGTINSSLRFKKDVTDMEDTAFIYNLRCVNFFYKTDTDNINKRYGLIAEEVETINSHFVVHSKDGVVDAIQDIHLIYPILHEVQKLKAENDTLKTQLSSLQIAFISQANQIQSILKILTINNLS